MHLLGFIFFSKVRLTDICLYSFYTVIYSWFSIIYDRVFGSREGQGKLEWREYWTFSDPRKRNKWNKGDTARVIT